MNIPKQVERQTPRRRGDTVNTNSIIITPFPLNDSLQICLEGTGRDWKGITAENMLAAVSYAADRGVRELFLPSVSKCNGLVASPYRFGAREFGSVIVRDGVSADAVAIGPRSAVAIASADCPTLVLWSSWVRKAVVGHASRDSLLRGLVGNMVRYLHPTSEYRSHIQAFLALGIGPESFEHRFDHPTHGGRNLQMVHRVSNVLGFHCFPGPLELGRMDVFRVVEAQLSNLGVSKAHVSSDRHDTFADRLPDGTPAWHSHRRGDKSRNLVFVHWKG
ncbi:MAG: laccase domain-containing protein [bacterium]|nr:laccase domain-containing protein [bacterium]